MAVVKTGALIVKSKSWHAIDWQRVKADVRRLQMRIAKAVTEGKYGKVRALQWLLTHSFNAKAMAVKRVTSNNILRSIAGLPQEGRF